VATVHLPDDLAQRLEAEAARRRTSVEALAVEAIQGQYGTNPKLDSDALEAFIGSFDSGDPAWAGTDTHVLRAEAARRRRP